MHTSNRRRRFGAFVASAALVASGAVALAPATAQAAKEPTGFAKVIDVPTLLPNVPGDITGQIGAGYERTVYLEQKQGSKWVRIAKTTSNKADGTYIFRNIKLADTAQLRIDVPPAAFILGRPKSDVEAEAKARQNVAKKAAKKAAKAKKYWKNLSKKKGVSKKRKRKARLAFTKAAGEKNRTAGAAKTWANIAKRKPIMTSWAQTDPVIVEVMDQEFTLTMLPGIAQPGTSPAAPSDATIVNARVFPSQPGRPVTLERKDGASWVTVGTENTDVLGNTIFTVEVGKEYRATTIAHGGGSAGTTATVTAPSFELDFEEEFSGSTLAPTWKYADRAAGTVSQRNCAITDSSSSRIANGVFEMGVSKDPARTGSCDFTDDKGVKHKLPYMRNTQVTTSGTYSYRYGIAAARIKVQSAEGMHSSFWSNPLTKMVANDSSKGVEVDVMEYFGDTYHEKGIGAFVHRAIPGKTAGDLELVKEGDVFTRTPGLLADGRTVMSEQYSVFSLEWTPKEYIFRLDGREFYRTSSHVSQVDQYLMLSMLTSSWEMPKLVAGGDAAFKDNAKVDWVRVWKP